MKPRKTDFHPAGMNFKVKEDFLATSIDFKLDKFTVKNIEIPEGYVFKFGKTYSIMPYIDNGKLNCHIFEVLGVE